MAWCGAQPSQTHSLKGRGRALGAEWLHRSMPAHVSKIVALFVAFTLSHYSIVLSFSVNHSFWLACVAIIFVNISELCFIALHTLSVAMAKQKKNLASSEQMYQPK